MIFETMLLATLTANITGYLGAYLLTHHRNPNEVGWAISRPQNHKLPIDVGLEYSNKNIPINQTEWLSTWLINAPDSTSKGTVILFHGKGSTKSDLLASAEVFHYLSYDTLLVDFRGSGDSSGDTTTLGVQEAEDVAIAVNYIQKLKPHQPIILYGISMGSAAILRAIAKENIQPNAIILELPFARLLSVVKNQLKLYKLPPSIMGELFVFWGGIQHQFNGFLHNPIDYTQAVNCPTLIFYSDRDPLIDVSEVEELHKNLKVPKKLVIFPDAEHQLLVTVDQQLWQQNVNTFLNNI